MHIINNTHKKPIPHIHKGNIHAIVPQIALKGKGGPIAMEKKKAN